MTELCIHVANVFYLVSFLGRDMLWLRTLTCAGLVLGIVFFACQPAPMYGPAAWHVAFLVINLVQIARLVAERRRLLTEEQEELGETAFEDHSHEELVEIAVRTTRDVPDSPEELHQLAERPLDDEDKLLRDLAFEKLSRKELIILVTRRMWASLKRLNPLAWRRRRTKPTPEPKPSEHEWGPVTHRCHLP